MGIWSRLMKQLRGADAFGSELDASALEGQLDEAVEQLTQRLVDARAAVASMLQGAARLAQQARAEATAADECEKNAAAALEAGDEEYAREALRRRRIHSDAAQSLSHELEEHKRVADQLLRELRQLNEGVEQAKRERSALLVRLRRAQARQALADGMNDMASDPLSGAEPLGVFERIGAQIRRVEAEARAGEEIRHTLTGLPDGALSSLQAEDADRGLDDDLSALRAKMGLAEAGGAVAMLRAHSADRHTACGSATVPNAGESSRIHSDDPDEDPEQRTKT